MHGVAGDRVALGVDVHVDHLDQAVDGGRALPLEGGEDGGLALDPVGDVVLEDGLRVLDDVAVARCDLAQAHAAHPLERVEVGGHVAVGRTDHHRRALHDVVAGEERVLLLELVAEVVRRVAGGVDGGEAELRRLDLEAVGDHRVHDPFGVRDEGEHLGAGALLEARGAGRVVLVGVGEHDPADAVAAAAGDGIEVLVVGWARIDHRDLVDAHEVGVGAGAGHDPGVGGEDAPHQRAEGPRHAHDHLRRRRSFGGLGDAHDEVSIPTGASAAAARTASVSG